MGIFCEINLCRPSDGRYTYQPGSIISGEIRYFLQEECEFSAITVSLKGAGHIYIEDREDKRRDRLYRHENDEVYIDLDNVIYTNEKGGPHPIGQYQNQFSFQLPYNIPASTEFVKDTLDYYVECSIKYYIRIKFERPGWYKLNKKYKKELNVISGQMPRMATEPMTYGDQKRLIQLSSLFSSKKGMVSIKATIENSVLRPGEFVKIHYEIDNSTNKTIKGVQVKVFEVEKYYTKYGEEIKIDTEIENMGFTCGAVSEGETGKFLADIMVPEDFSSLDHCKFLSRDYSVVAIVRLPTPHINLRLEVPFQVISAFSSSFVEMAGCSNVEYTMAMGTGIMDSPPSYWAAMGEDKYNDKLQKSADR